MDRLDVGRPGFRAVRVRVTARDIQEAEKLQGCFTCPLARAINRHLKPGLFSGVSTSRVALFDASGHWNPWGRDIALPSRARAFSVAFDAGGAPLVKPFAFNLPLPVEVLKRSPRPGVARG